MNKLILQAIKISGGQAKLAEACQVTQAAVSKWANNGTITLENAFSVEKATNGQVTAKELRPDVAWPE